MNEPEREEIRYLKETKEHMKSQMESLQYLNNILLEEESNKDKEIEYLETELGKAYNIINKFKNSMQIEVVEELRNELNWLKETKDLANEELNKTKLLN